MKKARDDLVQMQINGSAQTTELARKWKVKNDLLKTGNRDLLVKYERKKKLNAELTTENEKLKADLAQYKSKRSSSRLRG